MRVKDRLKELRLAAGLTQQTLADKTGISQSSIARWELGESEPTASAIVVLAKFFGETSDYILGLSE